MTGRHTVRQRLRAGLLGLALILAGGAFATAAAAPDEIQAGATLDAIRARGFLRCGVSSVIGAERQDASGEWFGFGIDLCRALAAATLGNAHALQVAVIDGELRFEGLIAGEYDVLFAQASWTMERETSRPILFTNVIMHDHQGFIGLEGTQRPQHLFESPAETVCVLASTTSAYHLRDLIARHRLNWRILAFRTREARNQAFIDQRCTLLTGDHAELAAFTAFRPAIGLISLPDLIGHEPISPAVRDDDPHWFETVRWAMFALIAAEREKLSSETISSLRDKYIRVNLPSPYRRLLGLEPDFGAPLRLKDDWAFQIIRQVGNYAEIWTRNLGEGSPLNLPRNENRLIEDGGLLFAPPFR